MYLLLNKGPFYHSGKLKLKFRTNFCEILTKSICEFAHFNLHICALNSKSICEFVNLRIWVFTYLWICPLTKISYLTYIGKVFTSSGWGFIVEN